MGMETIRDVLIRVSIENGKLALGSLDTSAYDASIAKAKASAQSLSADLKIVSSNDAIRQMSSAGAIPKLGADLQADLDKMRQSIAAAKESGGGLSSMMSGLSGTSAILTGGLAILGTELKSLADRYEEVRTAAQNYRRDQEQDVERAARNTMALQNIQTESALGFSRRSTNNVGLQRIMADIAGRETMEAGLRDYEATNANPRFKQQRRQFEEFALPRQQELAQTDAQIADRRKRIDVINAQLERLETDKNTREGQLRNAVNSNRETQSHAFDEDWMRFGLRQGLKGASALGLYGGINRDSGYYNSQHAAGAESRKNLAEMEKMFAAQDLAAEKNRNQLLEERKQKEGEILAEQQKQLTTTRELQQAAYNMLQQERERVKGVNISFGMASIVEQNQALQQQRVHESILKKRAENREAGRPEDENIPQYNMYQMSHSALGGIAEETKRQQAMRTAAKKGFKPESNEEEFQKNVNQQDKLPVAPVKADISDSVNTMIRAADTFNQSLERLSGTLAERLQTATRTVEEMIAQLNQWKLKR